TTRRARKAQRCADKTRGFTSSASPRENGGLTGEPMTFKVELEQEADGRWIAEVIELPGVLAYGATPDEARAKVQALALRVLADRLEHGEAGPDLVNIS